MSSGLLAQPVRQDSLEAAHSTLAGLLQIKTDRLRAQILALADLDNLIERFDTAQSQLEQLTPTLAAARYALTERTDERAQTAVALSALQDNILVAQQRRIAIGQQLERLMNEAAARQQIDQRTVARNEARDALSRAEDDYKGLREQHESNQQLRLQHELINKQIQSLVQTEADLQTGQQLIAVWVQKLQRIGEVEAEVGLAQEKSESAGKELADAMSTHHACEATVIQARSHYQALGSTADAIRQAVASIAAHLPADRGDCPVCREEHGAEKLHARVKQALQAIDPNLAESERHLRIATEELVVSQAAVSTAQTALQACQQHLSDLEAEQLDLGFRIIDFRTHAILASESVSLARESVRLRMDANASAKQELVEKQANLAPPLNQEDFDQTAHAYDLAARIAEEARQSQSEAAMRLDESIASLSAITAGEPPARQLDELSTERVENRQLISDLNAQLDLGQAESDTRPNQLSELTNSIQGIEAQVAHAQSQLAILRATWHEFLLPGDPLAEAAESHKVTLRASLAHLERHSQGLDDIKVEISAWAKLEESRLAQRLLDARRLELSEEAFEVQLEASITEARIAVRRRSQLSLAMDTLDKFLKLEIGNVQKHVVKVVPRWQALLKRIVREPRFSETSLEFYSAWNKERAEVSVPLNGKAVPVPSIASEAQLTDLQLTFLLSMAMSHQWSPWKALLLDDPTQHHDLVHASAVFDVLRDYIVDHGFQVVIATHDALQARYFLRKLQNDGIDAKIWTLVPTAQGVMAEEGHSKHHVR